MHSIWTSMPGRICLDEYAWMSIPRWACLDEHAWITGEITSAHEASELDGSPRTRSGVILVIFLTPKVFVDKFLSEFSMCKNEYVSYCIVLNCIVLYCIVLYCIALYCIVLYCITLYCIVLHCIVLYCIALYSLHIFHQTFSIFWKLI